MMQKDEYYTQTNSASRRCTVNSLLEKKEIGEVQSNYDTVSKTLLWDFEFLISLEVCLT